MERQLSGEADSGKTVDPYFDLPLLLLCVAGTDGYFRRIGPAWTAKLGWSVDELRSRPFAEFVHPDDRPRLQQEIARVVRVEDPDPFELRALCRDGGYRWLLFAGRLAPGTDEIHAFAIDVTDRHADRDQLQRREDLLRQMGQLASVGGWELTLATMSLRWSDEVYRIHEVAADFVPTVDTALAFYAPDSRGDVTAAVERCMGEGEPWDLKLGLVTARGHRRRVRAIGRAEIRDGRVVRIYGAFQDITAEWEAQRALSQQADELSRARDAALEAARAKGVFLATMSHELRTPLNGVLGMTGLLLDTPLSSEQRELADTIRTSGEALLSLVNDVLDYSKIEAGRVAIDAVSFDLRALVGDALEIVTATARFKDLTLDVEIDGLLPPALIGDPARLRQVLLNLLGNALKFTDRGGVRLRVRRQREHFDPVGVRFEVIDTGVGIAADAVSSLFERFTQVDDSSTRRHGGAGLGLAISKHLVELMGGGIGVISAPGEGSTFWFTVRLGIDAGGRIGPSETAAPATAPRIAAGRRVLVAEDNAVNQKVATRMLERLGLDVDVVGDGDAAATAVLTRAYDLVLMDCQMPGADGYSATAMIRARETTRHTHIVAMTANVMEGDRDRCLAAGMDDYLSKPVRLPDLIRTLERWIPAS
jgi:PAS domain S-box-containing protein